MLRRGICHVECSKNIVLDRFKYMRFHHRHMLEGCRVINNQRPMEAKYFVHPGPILDTPDLRIERDSRECGPHLLFDFKQRRLRIVEADNARRLKARNLPAQLRPD